MHLNKLWLTTSMAIQIEIIDLILICIQEITYVSFDSSRATWGTQKLKNKSTVKLYRTTKSGCYTH